MTAARMIDQPTHGFRVPITPGDVPGLIAFWDFQQPSGPHAARAGERYVLEECAGPIRRVEDPEAPWGPLAAEVAEGQWWRVERARCPRLDIHGPTGHCTVLAWIRRGATARPQCEFIAGQWNETAAGRQYGLFVNIRVWGGSDQVCGHVSRTGGPTPGYRYCMDGAIGATAVPLDRWCCVGMSYDGVQARAWLDGRMDARDGVNPYPLAGGLHDGGPGGSDFTVCAVHRSGEMGNFFRGRIGGLAVFARALGPAEIWALSRPLTLPAR